MTIVYWSRFASHSQTMGCCQGHLLQVRTFGGQGDNYKLPDTRGVGSEAPLGPSDFLPALPDEGCGVSPSNESYWALG